MADDPYVRIAELEAELAQRDRQLAETLAQQAATSEILRSIATSPTDAQPVLDAIAESAVGLTGSVGGGVSFREGNFIRVVSVSGGIRTGHPVGTLLDLSDVHPGHVATVEGRTIHIPDRSTPEFRAQYPTAGFGPNATLHVPLIAHTGSIGNI